MQKARFFVTCCLAVCLTLGGCAKEEPPLEAPAEIDASPSEVPAEPEEETSEEDLDVFLAKLEMMSDDELDVLFGDESLTDDEFNALIEVMDARAAAREADKEPHGIIAVVVCHARTSTYNIFSIDPDSGDINNIATFKVVVSSDTDKCTYTPASYYAHSANCQEIFSHDYSKIAVMQFNSETGETHAGWYDNNGVFFDVTLAMNPNSNSGFSDVIRQNGTGFTADGEFIYSDGENAKLSPHYVVPMDNLSASLRQSFSWPEGDSLGEDIYVTDRLNDSQCIVDVQKEDTSKLYNSATQTFTDYIPESSRTNWGGVISPDGQSVAFLSKQATANGIELFITNVDGGEPTKIDMPQTINDLYGDVWPREIVFGHAWCSLLDWR